MFKKLSIMTNAIVFFGMVGFGVNVALQAKAERMEVDMLSVNALVEYIEQQSCMQEALFFEARDQPEKGITNVAWVIMNRVESKRYPNTICDVVHQGLKDSNGRMVLNKCQFSYYCDGKDENMEDIARNNEIEANALILVSKISENVINAFIEGEDDPTHGATMYHTRAVSPSWSDHYDQIAILDDHIFYR